LPRDFLGQPAGEVRRPSPLLRLPASPTRVDIEPRLRTIRLNGAVLIRAERRHLGGSSAGWKLALRPRLGHYRLND
jgi:hypothetical protein